jgi:hypothetical protein
MGHSRIAADVAQRVAPGQCTSLVRGARAQNLLTSSGEIDDLSHWIFIVELRRNSLRPR